MILRKPDGVTLYYTDASGNEISSNPMSGDSYMNMLQTLEAQQDMIVTNTAAVSDYHQKLANFQANLDAGRASGEAPPVKPQQMIVDDTGVVTHADFVPPLPDPVFRTITPSSGTIKATPNLPPDRLDVVISLLMTLNGKIDKLGAK